MPEVTQKLIIKKEKYLIFSDNITYDKAVGKISTRNNSRAISEGILLNADIFNYDEKQNILEAEGKVRIDDKIENYILETKYVNYKKIYKKYLPKAKLRYCLNLSMNSIQKMFFWIEI